VADVSVNILDTDRLEVPITEESLVKLTNSLLYVNFFDLVNNHLATQGFGE
jgi:hypothetical protein